MVAPLKTSNGPIGRSDRLLEYLHPSTHIVSSGSNMRALALQQKSVANAAPKAAPQLRAVAREEVPENDGRSMARGGTNLAAPPPRSGNHPSSFGHSIALLPALSSAPLSIQPKLKINQPGDKYEQEADRVAEMVMRMPEPTVQRKCACGGGGCSKCQGKHSVDELGLLQMKRIDASSLGPDEAPPIVHEVLREPGQKLDAGTKGFMESRMGHDLSHVRIHSDAQAARSSHEVNAHAYTVGHNIVFGAGAYSTGSVEGRRLLAHELTHTVQQSSGDSSMFPASSPPLQRNALSLDKAADQQMLFRQADPEGRVSHGSAAIPTGENDGPSHQGNQEGPVSTPASEGISCESQGLTRQEYLAQPNTSTGDFGLTRIDGQFRVPDVNTVAARGGVRLEETDALPPPITSVYTQAGTFTEGTHDCPSGRYPLRWRILPSGATAIRNGELEHCSDIRYAFDISLRRYADAVNRLARRGTVYANNNAAVRAVTRITHAAPSAWMSIFRCLADKTLVRDNNLWHRPHPESFTPRRGCEGFEYQINRASLPYVDRYPSSRIIQACGELGTRAAVAHVRKPEVEREPPTHLSQLSATPLSIQPKLKINQPGDKYEQEADRVADMVMRMPEPTVQRKCSCGGGGCSKCQGKHSDDEHGLLQMKRVDASSLGPDEAPPIVHEVLRQPGQPLDAGTRGFMEPRLGHDLGAVRIHADGLAARSAKRIGANAYAVGQHIAFATGQYAPMSGAGAHLLAHEIVHTLQQAPIGVRRQDAACASRYSRATSFAQFIDLIREAERRLIAGGVTATGDRVHVLRGIYYGTEWSADFDVEQSPVRNAGFQAYTASATPADPRLLLTCGLFEALKQSQDLVDGRRRVDIGHLIIGLDARRNRIARNIRIPTQGGTGLDISTWLGDLGGGAGMLASQRVSSPTTRAMTKFRGTDFGGPINLEGDVAGFVVGAGMPTGTNEPVGLAPDASTSVADMLAEYLLATPSGTASVAWSQRCSIFMQMNGAAFDASGALTNRHGLQTGLKEKIEAFACWYLVNRLRQSNRLSIGTLRSASLHISGAAEEMATIFVDALEHCRVTPGSNLQATGSGPSPSPIGTSAPTACSGAISAMETVQEAERLLREGEQAARGLWDRAQEFNPF